MVLTRERPDYLSKLLEPYRHATSGAATTDAVMAADPLYSLLMQEPEAQPQHRGGGGAPVGSGSLFELFWPGNDPVGGHSGHLHVAAQRIVPLLKNIQGMGFDVGEHPKFGGVDPVHTQGSHHYRRQAGDINWNAPSSGRASRFKNEAQALNWLARWIQKRRG